ncbi:MAG: HD domain-containing phosphohydrolase [Fimbriimonas sp.]
MKRILFVDDEPRVLDGLRRMMWSARHQWEGVYARSVSEARACLAEEGIDAVVSDLNMPGETGIDLLRTVRNDPRTRTLPFFLLTGNGEMGLRRAGLELGASDFLSKPCDFAELSARLHNALTLKEFQDAIQSQNDELEKTLAERAVALERARRETLFRLAKAAEARDADTGNHIIRVGFVSQILANELGMDEATQRRILLTSPLHDVGKIGIPDEILRKPGRLDDHERAYMQTHCRIGFQILAGDLPDAFRLLGEGEPVADDFMAMAATIALSHHERWDGNGYPERRTREEIPVEARIVSVADAYDALRSARPYKGPFSPEVARRIIEEGRGTQFDPGVVDAFVTRIAEIELTVDFLSDRPDRIAA